MITEQIRDAMEEVAAAAESIEQPNEQFLMHQAHHLLGVAYSLVFEVNRLRLGELVNGKVESFDVPRLDEHGQLWKGD